MGKLAGRFYDSAGAPSAELARVEAAAARAAAGEAARAATAASGGPPADGEPCQLRRDADGGALAKGGKQQKKENPGPCIRTRCRCLGRLHDVSAGPHATPEGRKDSVLGFALSCMHRLGCDEQCQLWRGRSVNPHVSAQ